MKLAYINFLADVVKLQITKPSQTSNDHQDIICLICSHIFSATPKSKITNYKQHGRAGCPLCTKSAQLANTDAANIKRLHEMQYELFEPYNGLKKKILLRNLTCPCERKWKTTPERIFSGNSFCKPCNDDRKRKRFDVINRIRSVKDDGKLTGYRAMVTSLTNKTYEKYKTKINPNNFSRKRSGGEGYHLDHIVSIVKCYRNNVPPEVAASVDNLELVKWKDNAIKWSKPTKPVPPSLKPFFMNDISLHSAVATFLVQNNIVFDEEHITNNAVFNFKIGNVVIKLCSFADYKESNLKTKSYLRDMRNSALQCGLSPMIVFQNEILTPRTFEIVKSRILNKLKIAPIKIYARRCKIIEVPTTDKTKFLNANHIQGTVGSAYNYGLVYNDELVGMMTFSETRKFLNSHKENEFELLRYATKTNTNIVGGASRLLTHFIRTVRPSNITSYGDLRWGDGLLYTTIGMKEVKTTDVNYWYIVNGNLKHRYGFRKNVLNIKFPEVFNKSKTEYEIMLASGYDRIWDCGSKLFSMNCLVS